MKRSISHAPNAVDYAIQSVYRAGAGAKPWRDTLAALSGALDSPAAALWKVNIDTESVSKAAIGYKDTALAAYSSGDWRWDPLVRDHLLGGRRSPLDADANWARHRANAGMKGLRSVVLLTPGVGVFFSVSRDENGQPFTDDDQARFDQLAFHLTSALQTATYTHPSTGIGSYLLFERVGEASLRYSLTPAERRIVGYLVSGVPTEQIAGHLRVTRGTLRFHLKSIYSKSGTGGQAELVGLILREAQAMVEPSRERIHQSLPR